MAGVRSERAVRESPFRETEWDRRLDDMLEDLENSAANNSDSKGSKNSDVGATRSASQQRSTGQNSQPQHNGYGSVLQKSKSGSSLLQENADSMLKEMDSALKESSNFIESHRSSSSVGPGTKSNQEYHEYKSYSTNENGGGGNGGGFNLESQVQHMMPTPSPSLSGLIERSKNTGRFPSGSQVQQSSNATSYQQQQQQQQQRSHQQQQVFTTYKVQSNQYSSSGERKTASSTSHDINDNERPGSRLKQNIDELDTLLSDLNSAKHQPGHDSDDYSFNNGQHAVRSFNDYSYQTTSSGRLPSPVTGCKGDGTGLSSPSTVRKVSPGPVSSTPRRGGRDPSPASKSMAFSSSHQQREDHKMTTTSSLHEYHRSGSPYSDRPRVSSPSRGGDGGRSTPTGASYYNKYHSTQSHQSDNGPVAFPTNGTGPRVGTTTQSPPKRVDDLMMELSEFDPSIQPTRFVEPTSHPTSTSVDIHHVSKRSTTEHDFGSRRDGRDRSPSPPRSPAKPQTSSGPAVYYPPGEMFSSTKGKYDTDQSTNLVQDSAPAELHATPLEHPGANAKARGRAEYGYKDKGHHSPQDGKHGAAVVPICLPLCCAAPCVIL